MHESMVPRLAPGVRLQQDRVRGTWVLQAPERVVVLDEIALEVVRLVDGSRPIAAAVDDLAGRFAAPRDEIAADVTALLEELAERGLVWA